MGRVNKHNIDHYLFKWKEGDLSASEAASLNKFLANNPEFKSDKEAWSSAFVNPMPKAVYAHKDSLKKKSKAGYVAIAAASLLLLIGSASLFQYIRNSSDLEFNVLEGDLASLNSQVDHFSFDDIDVALTNESQVEHNETLLELITNNNTTNTTAGTLLHQQATSNATTNEVANNSDMANTVISELFTINFDGVENEVFDPSIILENQELTNESMLAEEKRLAKTKESKERMKFKTTKFKRFMDRFKNAMASGSGLINLRQTDMVIAGYNHLDFNPAFTGSGYNSTFQTQGYGRWINSDNPMIGMNLSADGYVHAMKSAVGVQANYENFGKGMYQNVNVSLFFSPKINISKTITIEPAVKFTMGQKWMSESKVSSGSEFEFDRGIATQLFNEGETPNGTKAWYRDLGAGINLNTKWFYASVAVDNILRHKTGVYSNDGTDRSMMDINASIGTNYQSYNKKWIVSPFIAYRNRGKFNEMWFGSGAQWNWLTFGTGVSTRADVAANLGFKTKGFQMFYQYEFTKSQVSQSRMSAHQVTMRINTKPNRAASRIINL